MRQLLVFFPAICYNDSVFRSLLEIGAKSNFLGCYHIDESLSIFLRRKDLVMEKKWKRLLTVFFAVCLTVSCFPVSHAAYTPPYSTVKVGLYYGSNALDGANIENDTGSGFRFGYFDSNRDYHQVGYTEETKLSMVVDRTVYYSSTYGNYYEGNAGSVVVGCYHIQLEKAYADFESAKSAAAQFTSVHAFVKYYYGKYYVSVGQYTSKEKAEAAAATLSINQNWAVNSGTAYTVAVVITGTNTIVFEFDCGSEKSLALGAKGTSHGLSWFKGTRYYGGLEYSRVNGGDITVINYVLIEDYVPSVVYGENYSGWPIETYKAQSVCARTYAMSHLNDHKSSGFDVCTTDCCQVYTGAVLYKPDILKAASETAGEYLMYNGKLCETYFFSSSGGATESCVNVWVADIPYLKGKVDPYEAAIADEIYGYRWTVKYTAKELTEKLQSKGVGLGNIVSYEVTKRTAVGNVYEVTFTDENGNTKSYTKDNARHILNLNSIHFDVTNSGGSAPGSSDVYINDSSSKIVGLITDLFGIGSGGKSKLNGDVYAINGSGTVSKVGASTSVNGLTYDPDRVFTITGAGLGHSIGYSQWGAYSMAKYYNKTYKEILTFYYDGTQVVKAS